MTIVDYKQRLHPQMRAVLEKLAEVVPDAGKVHELSVDDAGVSSQLKIYDGVLHGFLHYTRVLDAANEAIDDDAEAIRTTFALESA